MHGLKSDIENDEGDPKQQVKLLNKIIRCYSRLCDNTRARKALRECLPTSLKEEFFNNLLAEQSDGGITEQLLNRLRSLVRQEETPLA